MENKKLDKILLRYSGAATVFLGAPALHAQIEWTDIQDTTLNTNGARYEIDLDGDSARDYTIVQLVDSIINGNNFTGLQVEYSGPAGRQVNQVLGLDYMNYNYPFRLNVGDTIGVGKPFQGLGRGASASRYIGYMGLGVNEVTYPNSQFVDTVNGITNGFLGLRFGIVVGDTVDNTHYGWLRLDVAADLRSVTIKDFAYQQTPDSAIQAGFGSPLGIDEGEVEKPGLVQRGQFLDIALPESFTPEAEVVFINMSGQLIRKEDVQKHQSSLPLEGLPKGVLVAVVRSNGIETSKKVVVY